MFQRVQKKKELRVYTDSQQTIKMKQQITQKYIHNIMPYELIIQALQIQNNTIYSLQQQYLQLLNQSQNSQLFNKSQSPQLINQSKQSNQYKQSNQQQYSNETQKLNKYDNYSIRQKQLSKKQKSTLLTYRNKLILEKKKFIEEGLISNQQLYEIQYKKLKEHLIEEMRLKKQQIEMVKMNTVNIFVNFQENILDQLISFSEQRQIEKVEVQTNINQQKVNKHKEKGNKNYQNEIKVNENNNKNHQKEKENKANEKIKQLLMGWKNVYDKQVVNKQQQDKI